MFDKRVIPLSTDMGSIGDHTVRAHHAAVQPGIVTLEVHYEPMPTEWHEGHLLFHQWTAVDDHGTGLSANSMSGTRSGGLETLRVTFTDVSPAARWVDITVDGYDGRPLLTVRVDLDDDGGASVPAIPPSLPPPGEQSAEAEFD